MHFNKVYSVSSERIITRSPSMNTFDIELQHPQPRRRQTPDQQHGIDQDKDQYEARMFSIPLGGKNEFGSLGSEPLSLMKNNLLTIPTELSTRGSAPIVISSTPEIIEEK